MEWLRQQPNPGTDSAMGDTAALSLLETIKVNYIEVDKEHFGLFTKFTVSELSGSVGIASVRDKPSLSVVYPGTDKPPLILSRDDRCGSALVVKILGQEYLAAVFRDDIHLWNLTTNTSSVVHKLKEDETWLLCLIDERTVACVAQFSSLNEFMNICILKTDLDMWTLSSTHLVIGSASDISCVKTTDGTPCLLLSFPPTGLVQSVELVGGKVHWQVDRHQTHRSFFPWSLCTDGSTVFVADFALNQLYLLSVDDGSVLRSINLHPFGISFVNCVRLQGDHLFVGHMNKEQDTYCITKFIKPTDF